MKLRLLVAAANFALMSLLVAGADAAESKILSAEVMRHVGLNELTGEFERMTGHKVTIIYDSAGAVRNGIQDGEIADVAIIQKPAVEAEA
jgi:molybdate transport system substrate-binding protein